MADYTEYHGETIRRFFKPPTNADRIRAMSDEELAKLLSALETSGRVFGPDGKAYWLDWLRSPAGGEQDAETD